MALLPIQALPWYRDDKGMVELRAVEDLQYTTVVPTYLRKSLRWEARVVEL